MATVRMLGRSVLRGRWWGTIAVALLIGIAGAAVLGAVAGARRTETAYTRLLAAENVGDLAVGTQGIGNVPVRAVRALPHVRWAEARKLFVVASRNPDGRIVFQRDLGAATVGGSPRPNELYRRDEGQVIDGRPPDPSRVNEVAVNEVFARNTALGVGDTYRAWLYNLEDVLPIVDQARGQGRDPTDAELRPVMTPVDLEITEVLRSNTDLVVNESQSNDTVFATPAFVRRYRDKSFLGGVSVKLDDPVRDTAAFERALRRRLPDLNLAIQSTAVTRAAFDRVVGPYADALRIFALVTALTGIFVIGQALARLVAADAAVLPTAQALGATRRQRQMACAARATIAAGLGAFVALFGGYALSPLFPLGRARDAEPTPGLRFDSGVLLVGFAIVVIVLVAFALVSARVRVARATSSQTAAGFTPSRSVALLGRRGAPVGVVTGVGFAVQRDRRAPGTSLAATLVGIVAAIAATAAALTFATNLDDLVSSPPRYGWSWDTIVQSYSETVTPDLAARFRADHDLTAMMLGSRASIVVGGHAIPAYGFQRVRGDVQLGLPAGRMPHGAHEVAVGKQTMRDLGVGIGDHLSLPTTSGHPLEVRVVGQVLLPFISDSDTYGVAEGMAFDRPALRRLDPSAQPAFLVADIRSGATLAAVQRRYEQDANVYGPSRPGDVLAYSHVQSTPLLLAGLLAVLAAGVLAHVLLTGVRYRRHDLAILKTLGFTRRQVASSIAWMATTVVGVALAVGIVAGIVLGRWTWRSFADDLGIGERVWLPLLPLALLVVAALLLANVVALLPARSAARTRPAAVLRSE